MKRLGLAIALSAGLVAWGCFTPRQPGCAFSCAADGICPSGYSCASDGLCHRDDGLGVCDLLPQTDAATDSADDSIQDAGGDGG